MPRGPHEHDWKYSEPKEEVIELDDDRVHFVSQPKIKIQPYAERYCTSCLVFERLELTNITKK